MPVSSWYKLLDQLQKCMHRKAVLEKDAGMNQQRYEDINMVADYICFKCLEAGESVSMLKLHKLLYYVQAWHLAFFNKRLFEGNFEAWVHGPANRQLFSRYHGRSMYSVVVKEDLVYGFNELSQAARNHIDNVLDSYAHLSGSQLELLTHKESPWIEARGGLADNERCTTQIKEDSMAAFYRRMAT